MKRESPWVLRTKEGGVRLHGIEADDSVLRRETTEVQILHMRDRVPGQNVQRDALSPVRVCYGGLTKHALDGAQRTGGRPVVMLVARQAVTSRNTAIHVV